MLLIQTIFFTFRLKKEGRLRFIPLHLQTSGCLNLLMWLNMNIWLFSRRESFFRVPIQMMSLFWNRYLDLKFLMIRRWSWWKTCPLLMSLIRLILLAFSKVGRMDIILDFLFLNDALSFLKQAIHPNFHVSQIYRLRLTVRYMIVLLHLGWHRNWPRNNSLRLRIVDYIGVFDSIGLFWRWIIPIQHVGVLH